MVSQGGDREKLRLEIKKCLDLCDNERIREAILEILAKAEALALAISIVLSIVSSLALIAVVLSRIPLIRALLLPVLKQLEQQKSALEQGRTIEGIARRILDELL